MKIRLKTTQEQQGITLRDLYCSDEYRHYFYFQLKVDHNANNPTIYTACLPKSGMIPMLTKDNRGDEVMRIPQEYYLTMSAHNSPIIGLMHEDTPIIPLSIDEVECET